MATTYKDAGVDQGAKDAVIDRILRAMKRTHDRGVIDLPWGFAGLYSTRRSTRAPRNLRDPVLVACTDGVGTKLRLAQELDRHDTVGIDLVAMSVNDLLVTGASPLFFLDYIAAGKVRPRVLEALARGIIEGCRRGDCALLGGETAEMPGMYGPDDYDLAGFCVGIAERKNLLDGSAVRPGDRILALPSSGIHSNGYSLVRKIVGGRDLSEPFGKSTLGETLLTPTRIYTRAVKALLGRYRIGSEIRALANITGGGITENVPRILPKGCAAELAEGSWAVPPVFARLQEWGDVPAEEMRRVFNMGVGMIVVTAPSRAASVLRTLSRKGEKAREVGRIVKGAPGVRYRRG